MSDIQFGQRYVLMAEGGYGAGVGSLPQGAVVTPVEEVEPGTAGVGYSTENVVISTYADALTFPGTTIERTLAIALSAFDESFTLESDLPPAPPPENPDPEMADPTPPGGE
ncbi:hypothetical protein [Streptomyces sp. CB03238]|uniref:hypothetical protein n=1 Tax=Streptomyces sp. CB03238 TaxID=1907777 RepID=UPI000A121597|nr:hypothetical protein [Streptomyces sp. CB03238]ORT58162.1 hypothetical protein BKD26_19870 [Streptomyces sp. CB03238]